MSSFAHKNVNIDGMLPSDDDDEIKLPSDDGDIKASCRSRAKKKKEV